MRLGFLGSACALLALASAAAAQQAPAPEFTPEAVRAHVAFLADDLLEGRDAGARGYDIAALYVAANFARLGLKPAAADGGWYQQVPFVETRLARPTPTLTIGGRRHVNGADVLIGPSAVEAEQAISAPALFAGFGIDSPANGLDDYAGLDVRGKVVAVLSGFPKGMDSQLGAHLAHEKAAMAAARGAIGVITIPTRESLGRTSWERRLKGADEPAMTWVGPDGRPFTEAPGLRFSATLNHDAASELFAGAPASLGRVLDLAGRKGGRPKGFALAPAIGFERRSAMTRITSPNVLAVLPGSDPALAHEYVVLMAHLDHEGVDPTKAGDRIYNGALDNAAGVATMLEAARAFAEAPTRPRRSILFAAVTAEEDGLLGSEYLAKNPPVPADKIVGVVNLDMPVLLYDFTDVIAFGAEHSTLGPIVARAAAAAGVRTSPDPLPAENLFARSDHYSFVKEGVPSVFLMTGFGNGGEKAFEDFLAKRYHKVTDDLSQPIDWRAGAKFARLNYLIAKEIADADQRPRWHAGNFFGETFAKGQAKAAR